MNTHRITISKFKHFPAFSEETIAFTCDVLMDGKKVGTASCRGHGDSTVFHHDIAHSDKFSDYAEREKVADIVDGFVTEAIMEKQKQKDLKSVERKLSKALFFRTVGQKDNAYYSVKGDPNDAALRQRISEKAKEKGGVEVFINDLPIQQAVKYFFIYTM